MKIRLEKKFKDLEGKPLKDGDDDLTLSSVCVSALLLGNQDNVEGKEKYERYQLANKINKAEEVDISVDEISKLKKLIGEAYRPIIVGQAWDMLEGK